MVRNYGASKRKKLDEAVRGCRPLPFLVHAIVNGATAVVQPKTAASLYPYKCDECSESFKTWTALKAHERGRHGHEPEETKRSFRALVR